MQKKIIISIIILFLLIMSLMLFYSFGMSSLVIKTNPNNVDIKINDKEYRHVNVFAKKLYRGNYEIKVSKKDYESHEKEIFIKPRTKINLEINLEIKAEERRKIKKALDDYIKSITLLKNLEYKTKISKIENNFAEVYVSPTNGAESFIVVLQKKESEWQGQRWGEVSLDSLENEIAKENLIKELPYVTDNFEVDYIASLDQFYVTITKEPIDKAKKQTRAWFDKQGIDRNAITIKWILSPVLIRN